MEKKEQKTSYDWYSDDRFQQKCEVIKTLTKLNLVGTSFVVLNKSLLETKWTIGW